MHNARRNFRKLQLRTHHTSSTSILENQRNKLSNITAKNSQIQNLLSELEASLQPTEKFPQEVTLSSTPTALNDLSKYYSQQCDLSVALVASLGERLKSANASLSALLAAASLLGDSNANAAMHLHSGIYSPHNLLPNLNHYNT